MYNGIKKVSKDNSVKINKFSKVLAYIFATSIILESNSIYSQISGYYRYIRLFLIILAAISALLLTINSNGRLKINKTTLLYIGYVLLSSILLLINTDNKTGQMIIISIFIFMVPIFAFLLKNINGTLFGYILNCFVNVTVILCTISLFIWFLSSVIGVLRPNITIQTLWGNINNFKGYYYIHFDTQDVWWITGKPLIRNTGIFTEGPMYAVIIVIAQVFHDLISKEESRKHLLKTVILSTTMITTMSATGIICTVIILFLANRDKILGLLGKKNKFILGALAAILIIAALPILSSLAGSKSETGSAIHRSTDISNGIKVFANSPLIGKGVNHERPNESKSNDGYGYSNAIIPILTDGGVVLLAIYIFPVIILLSNKKHKENKDVYVAIIYLLILFTTQITYRLSLILLLEIIQVLPAQRIEYYKNLKRSNSIDKKEIIKCRKSEY